LNIALQITCCSCITNSVYTSLPSNRQYLSSDDCLEDTRYYQNCSLLYCGPPLFTIISTQTCCISVHIIRGLYILHGKWTLCMVWYTMRGAWYGIPCGVYGSFFTRFIHRDSWQTKLYLIHFVVSTQSTAVAAGAYSYQVASDVYSALLRATPFCAFSMVCVAD